ncbi:hypothetical protein KGF45_02255 [Clostridioides sp. ZZV14-6154]|uniref:major tail protein n=1 Tax=unclassified Clostridioides TaxID=2635829 RepID=UPI001D0F7B97|nr:hypothetical protein [Clostridioides sp. ZZV14-6150]MCC0659090.1 hypothetical protein [Clostridioides sp. ZZV14-6154]
MSYKEKIIHGFDNIHLCKIDENSVPVKILGGISVSIELKQPYKIMKSGGNENIIFYGKVSGTGKLNLLGLTADEEELIWNFKRYKNGIIVEDSIKPNNLRLLFTRKRRDGAIIYYCIYNVIFDIDGILAETDAAKRSSSKRELSFNVFADKKIKLTFFSMDTKSGEKEILENWFKEIQIPEKENYEL